MRERETERGRERESERKREKETAEEIEMIPKTLSADLGVSRNLLGVSRWCNIFFSKSGFEECRAWGRMQFCIVVEETRQCEG